MQISTVIDEEKNIRSQVVRGAIDVSELAEYLKGLYAATDSYSEMNVFWDLQEADFSAVSGDDVRTFMAYVGKIRGQGGESRAALVVSNDLDFGLSRMYQILMEGATSSAVEVFKDKDKAKQWIHSHRKIEKTAPPTGS
jgi:hypothetical protein